MTIGSKSAFFYSKIKPPSYTAQKMCDLCLEPINRFMVSYSVFIINTEGNNNKYRSREIRIVCRHCYINNEKIERRSF